MSYMIHCHRHRPHTWFAAIIDEPEQTYILRGQARCLGDVTCSNPNNALSAPRTNMRLSASTFSPLTWISINFWYPDVGYWSRTLFANSFGQFRMSLQRLQLEDPETYQPNFFWLSHLTPTELFYSFVKPNSSKSSLSTTIFGKQTMTSSRPPSSKNMSTKDEIAPNSGGDSAATTITSSSHRPDTPQAEMVEKLHERWKPGKKEWAVMITFVISNLVVALESSILVTVLPVRLLLSSCCMN